MKIASWNSEQSPLCSRCVDREETPLHIFQCSSRNAHQQHTKSMKTLRQKLRKLNTAPVILEAFTSIIESNRKGYDVPPKFSRLVNDEMKNLVRKVIQGQKLLGYDEFIRGYIYHQWDVVQNIYLQTKDINSEKTIWAAGVTKALWQYAKTMWQARNDYVFGKETGKQKSPKRKELLELLEKELTRTKQYNDTPTRQLRKNISKSKGNATLQALTVWLDMIRSVKENDIERKRQENITEMRAQPITRFFRAIAGTLRR